MSPKPILKVRRGFLIVIGIFAFIAAVLIALPFFIKPRLGVAKNTCVSNLKQIDGAKEQYGLEHKSESGDLVNLSDLIGEQGYIRRMPICPKGGEYSANPIGQQPTCSLGKAGDSYHSLPE